MKKLILLAAIAISVCAAKAQTTFGIKGGLNISNATFKSKGITITPDNNVSYHIGGILNYQFNPTFSLQPGLLLSSKGYSVKIGSSASEKTNLLYLEIPVNLVAKLPAGPVSILLYGGPYLGYGISGKEGDTDVVWGSGDEDMNRFDAGLNFGAGLQYNQFIFSLQYGLGLANLANSSDVTVNHRVIGISLAYMFQ